MPGLVKVLLPVAVNTDLIPRNAADFSAVITQQPTSVGKVFHRPFHERVSGPNLVNIQIQRQQ